MEEYSSFFDDIQKCMIFLYDKFPEDAYLVKKGIIHIGGLNDIESPVDAYSLARLAGMRQAAYVMLGGIDRKALSFDSALSRQDVADSIIKNCLSLKRLFDCRKVSDQEIIDVQSKVVALMYKIVYYPWIHQDSHSNGMLFYEGVRHLFLRVLLMLDDQRLENTIGQLMQLNR